MSEGLEEYTDSAIRPHAFHVLVFIVAVSLVLRVALIRVDRIVRWDEPDYLILGRHLFTGEGYTVTGGIAELHYAPLFPITAGLLYPLTHDMKLNSDVCYVLFGTLALLPFYWLARRLFGLRVGLAATLFLCLYPPLTASVPFWGTMLEPLYLFLIYTALCAVWKAWEEQSLASYVVSGALFGLAYLTKPEAIVYFGWMFALLARASLWQRKESARRVLVGMLGGVLAFALVLSPYIAFLYRYTGNIMLSGKLGVTYVAGQGAVDRDPGLYDRALSRLDEAGEEIIWFSPDRFKYNIWDLIRADPRSFVLRMWKNLNTLESMLFTRKVFPFYFLGLVALGLLGAAWDRERAIKELFLVASAVPVFIFLPFHIELRYFAPLLPLLLLWLAKGVAAFADWLLETWTNLRPGGRQSSYVSLSLFVLLTAVMSLYFGVLQPRVVREGLAGMNAGRRAAGLWLKENTAVDSLIMSRDTEVPFYAERHWSATPNEEYARYIAYVRKRGAQYVVVDEREVTIIRPQLEMLLEESSPPAGLRHAYTAHDPRGKTIVYEVLY